MKMITVSTLVASMLIAAGLPGAAAAQAPTPQRLFRLTMASAVASQEAGGRIEARAAKAAEALARANEASEAKAGDPPRHDAQGYYFSLAQTGSYEHTKANEGLGARSAKAYDQLRCRIASSLGPSGEPDGATWRVCPDALGHYRVSL